MSAQDTVTFYLEPQLRRQAANGNHNFIGKVVDVLTTAGLRVEYDSDDEAARLRAQSRPGFGMFLAQPPVNARGLTFRKTYIYPFWHIEKTANRWEWPVAKDTFAASDTDPRKAPNFYRFWRQRLFDDAPKNARRDGFVFVPLQDQLLTKQAHQFASPLDMVKLVLAHDPKRQVVATLDPDVTLSKDEELALEALFSQNDRLFVQTSGTARYLQNCDYIVTQDSGVGFHGLFYRKPLILFAQTDFHHIALNVSDIGEDAAFRSIDYHAPNYPAYLYWFLQQRAINAGRPEAKHKISRVLRDHGWPV